MLFLVFRRAVFGFLACLIVAGCSSGVRSKVPEAEEVADVDPVVPAANLPNGAVDPNAKGLFKRRFKIVDKQVAMAENPNYVETVNTIEAGDYFTAVAQGAFAAASQMETLGLQHFVNLHEAEHGKKPTFAEVDAYIKNNNLTLKGLYPYQVYAYDQATGKVSVLEDTVEREKHDNR